MGRAPKNQDKSLKIPRPPNLNLSDETKRGTAVVVFAALAAVTFLAALNLAGSLGYFLLKVLSLGFGMLAYFVPAFLLLVAVLLGKQKITGSEEKADKHKSSFYWRIYLGAFLMTGSIAGLIHVFYLAGGSDAWFIAQEGQAGGYLGALFGGVPFRYLEFWATACVLFALITIGVLVAFDVPLSRLLFKADQSPVPAPTKAPLAVKINSPASQGFVNEKVPALNPKTKDAAGGDEGAAVKTEVIKTKIVNPQSSGKGLELESMVTTARKDWKLPPFDLLDDGTTQVDSGNIELNVAVIKKTLSDFGIDVEMGEVNVGPTVTQYTLRPATGVKLSQIAALQNDLALSLAAHSIRMELPIPGKALVGIEVPNRATAIVRLKEVVKSRDYYDHKSRLAMALGRDVAGETMIADLAKMPHLLIAGATGTGKSVCINSLFISLLYRNTPDEVKFIVIDPKRVELNLYNGIPHLLTPVIIDHEKAINALKWAVSEMDRRYKLLSEVGKRNILEYNEASELRMPYIVILVDELADLMAVAQADVEAAIVRLAQMARAVGIHLVLATQRPSVDIITGLIKANITSRIAFAVASQIDSRTILDASGADRLLGNGDMLFSSAEFSKPKRVQGAFIGEKEVKKVVDFFKSQSGSVIYNEEVVEKPKRVLGVPGMGAEEESADDDLLEAAQEEVIRAGKASASLLQRRLRVGYARAARLLDLLEEKGIIGPGDGAKPRDVYGIVPADEKAEYGIEESETDDSTPHNA